MERHRSQTPQQIASTQIAALQMAVNGQEDELPARRNLVLRRESNEPLNEYLQQHQILYGAFPTVMPLGQGCGTVANHVAPLHVEARIFLMCNFMRRAARRQKLLMYLHNVKMRSDNARVMKAFVCTDSVHMAAFQELSTSEDFTQRLEVAVGNPGSDDAQLLLRQLSPSVMISGSRVPFSPLDRGTRAASELFASMRFFGAACEYWTLAFDETRNAIIARVSCFKHGHVNQDVS